MDPDRHIADPYLPTLPLPLLQPHNAADHDVGPQPPHVSPEFRNRPIRRHQQRKNVEPAVHTFIAHQPRVRTDNFTHGRQHRRIAPQLAVNQRIPRIIQRAFKPQQLRPRARRGYSPGRTLHLNDAVTRDPRRSQARRLQPLPRHRLHWITPNLADIHRLFRCVSGPIRRGIFDPDMQRPPLPALIGFLAAYDPHISDLALALREIILEEAPHASESIYRVYTVAVWFGFSGKMKDMFCYITTHTKHVNLGFPRGADLPDPNHVLEGDGKAMRHIRFATLRDLERPFVRRYIQAAMEQAAPAGTRGTGKSLIKTRA
jgi:hypothetical protein